MEGPGDLSNSRYSVVSGATESLTTSTVEEVMPPLYLSPSAMSSCESCSRDADDRARMTERVASIVPVEEVLAETIGTREGDYFQGSCSCWEALRR